MTNKSESRVTTSHWGAFQVLTRDGRIVGTADFTPDPHASRIAETIPAAVYHRTRVARPSIRRGWLQGGDRARNLRGHDEFVELPWDEALDITATELQRVIAEHGNGSIFGGSYGWASAGRSISSCPQPGASIPQRQRRLRLFVRELQYRCRAGNHSARIRH
jgi:biotin/methionine sulfoxide reductase